MCAHRLGSPMHRLWRDRAPSGGVHRAKAAVGRELELTPEGSAGLAGVADASVATVTSVFALCRVPDVEATLAQVGRVLAPGGVLVFLEHASPPGWRRRLQRAATPLWQRMAPGCHLDRDVPAAIRAAGLAITDVDRFPLPWAGALMVRGVQGVARVQAPRTSRA